MNKGVMLVALSLLIMLTACGESEVTGRRVAIPDSSTPTAAVVAPPQTSSETGTSAAEALADLKSGKPIETTETLTNDPKTGTFYPPVAVTGSGADALKEKTRALFEQEIYVPDVEVGTLGDFERER